MPETMDGGAEIPVIEMPSALRIRQRLGMIATSNSYREALIPAIETLGGETKSPEEFVSDLESLTADYAQHHRLGIVRQVQEGIPQIIDRLIDAPDQKSAALDAWETLKADIIAEGNEADKHTVQRYYAKRPSRHQSRRAKRRGRY